MTYTVQEQKSFERQRILATAIAKHTHNLLDDLKLEDRALRCLDLACGIGESTRLLASRLDASSEVTGVDTDAGLLDIARKTPSEGARISYQQGDAHGLRFEDETFDLVLARALLQHLSEPKKVLAEMLRACKRGGFVAVQEPDLAKNYCFPPNPAVERLTSLWVNLVASPRVGANLGSLFGALGYTAPRVEFEFMGFYDGAALKRGYRLSLEATADAIVKGGLADADEVAELVRKFEQIERDPEVLFLGCPFYYGWVMRR